jgi:hypothetical protein
MDLTTTLEKGGKGVNARHAFLLAELASDAISVSLAGMAAIETEAQGQGHRGKELTVAPWPAMNKPRAAAGDGPRRV